MNSDERYIIRELLRAFRLDEILDGETLDKLEEEGFYTDRNNFYSYKELPAYARRKLEQKAKKIAEEIEKNGYYQACYGDTECVLFVNTKDGIKSIWFSYDMQIDNRTLGDRVNSYLYALESLYKEAKTKKAKQAILEEAKYWLDDVVPSVRSWLPPLRNLCPTLLKEA